MSQSCNFSPPKSYMKVLFSDDANKPTSILYAPSQSVGVSFPVNQNNYFSNSQIPPPSQIHNNSQCLPNFQSNFNYLLNKSNIPSHDQFTASSKSNTRHDTYIKNYESTYIQNCSSNHNYQNQQYFQQSSMLTANSNYPTQNKFNSNDNMNNAQIPNLQNQSSMISADQSIMTIDMRGMMQNNNCYSSNNNSQYFQALTPNSKQSFDNLNAHEYNELLLSNLTNNTRTLYKNLDCLKTFPKKLEKFRDSTKLMPISKMATNKNNTLSNKNKSFANNCISYLGSILESNSKDIRADPNTNLTNSSVEINWFNKLDKEKLDNISDMSSQSNNCNINKSMPNYKELESQLINVKKTVRKYTKKIKKPSIATSNLPNTNDNLNITEQDFNIQKQSILQLIDGKPVQKYGKTNNLSISIQNMDNCSNMLYQDCSRVNTKFFDNSVMKKFNKKCENDVNNLKTSIVRLCKLDDSKYFSTISNNLEKENSKIERQPKRKLDDCMNNIQTLSSKFSNKKRKVFNTEEQNLDISGDHTDVEMCQYDCVRKLQDFKDSGQKIDNISRHLASKTSIIKHWSQYKKGETFLQMESCVKLATNIVRCCECVKNENTEASGCRFYSFRKLYCVEEKHLKSAGYPLPTEAQPDDILLWMADPEILFSSSTNRYYLTNVPKSYNSLAEIARNGLCKEELINSEKLMAEHTEDVQFSIIDELEILNQSDNLDVDCLDHNGGISINQDNILESTSRDQSEHFCSDSNESGQRMMNQIDAQGYVTEEIVSTSDVQTDSIIKPNSGDSSNSILDIERIDESKEDQISGMNSVKMENTQLSEPYSEFNDQNVTESGKNLLYSESLALVKSEEEEHGWIIAADIARYVLSNIGGRFCQLVEQEKNVCAKKKKVPTATLR